MLIASMAVPATVLVISVAAVFVSTAAMGGDVRCGDCGTEDDENRRDDEFVHGVLFFWSLQNHIKLNFRYF